MRPMVAFAMCAALACEHPTEQKAPTPLLLSAIATGYYTTCGVGIDGTGYCWGNGRYGQLGFIETDECSSIPGEDPCAHTPHAVDAAVKFTTVAAGGAHFCAITTMADAYCWGSDQFDSSAHSTPPPSAALCRPSRARAPRSSPTCRHQ